jgi:hypothetical protein
MKNKQDTTQKEILATLKQILAVLEAPIKEAQQKTKQEAEERAKALKNPPGVINTREDADRPSRRRGITV